MYLFHYLLPIAIYIIYKNKIMFWGLIFGNFIDLDHIYLRLVGNVPWTESICGIGNVWQCSGFFGYPLHSVYVLVFFIMISMIVFPFMIDDKKAKSLPWIFWISIGVLIHFVLDFIQIATGWVL